METLKPNELAIKCLRVSASVFVYGHLNAFGRQFKVKAFHLHTHTYYTHFHFNNIDFKVDLMNRLQFTILDDEACFCALVTVKPWCFCFWPQFCGVNLFTNTSICESVAWMNFQFQLKINCHWICSVLQKDKGYRFFFFYIYIEIRFKLSESSQNPYSFIVCLTGVVW